MTAYLRNVAAEACVVSMDTTLNPGYPTMVHLAGLMGLYE